MYLRLLKAFPKYAIVLTVLLVSTGMFAWWWMFRGSSKTNYRARRQQAEALKQQEIQKMAATLPERLGSLVLVDNDLYNIDTGELIFRNWLPFVPQRLFYHPGLNRLMAQTEYGIVRFGMDGRQDAILGGQSPTVFTNNGSLAIYVKNGDIWTAEPDWEQFKFSNDHQVTNYGQFVAPYFAANVILASEKACVVRQQNKLIRVDLTTGDFRPIDLPTLTPGKRRSPDCEFLIADDGNGLITYDVNEPETKQFPKGEGRAFDFQWLSNDKCAYVVSGTHVCIFDRRTNTQRDVVNLPFKCNRINTPSPDGRYVFCDGDRQGLAMVDTAEKKAEVWDKAPDQMMWIGGGAVLYAKDVPNSEERGTWLFSTEGISRRLMSDPYLVANITMPSTGSPTSIVFSTRDGIYGTRSDESSLREIARLSKAITTIQSARACILTNRTISKLENGSESYWRTK